MASSLKPRQRRLQISIAGSSGSGKTTVGRRLATELTYRYHSTGALQRATARSMDLTTLQLNRVAETVPGIDERIDADLRSFAGQARLVVDSRMAWHFLPDSFRVFLIVSIEEAARRIMRDQDRGPERYGSLSEAIGAIEERANSERMRFFHSYGVEISSFQNYDYVIDTEMLDAAQVAEYIIVGHKLWLLKLQFADALVSPVLLFPSRSAEASDGPAIAGMIRSIERSGVSLFDAPTVLSFGGRLIILRGHCYVRAAIKAGVAAVPVKIATDIGVLKRGALTTDEFVRSYVNMTTVRDWEYACGIKLSLTPSRLRRPL